MLITTVILLLSDKTKYRISLFAFLFYLHFNILLHNADNAQKYETEPENDSKKSVSKVRK